MTKCHIGTEEEEEGLFFNSCEDEEKQEQSGLVENTQKTVGPKSK